MLNLHGPVIAHRTSITRKPPTGPDRGRSSPSIVPVELMNGCLCVYLYRLQHISHIKLTPFFSYNYGAYERDSGRVKFPGLRYHDPLLI